MIVRLAIRLARSGQPSHRYRRTVLPLAAGLSTVLLLSAAGLVALALREQERFTDRTALLAQRPRNTDLWWLERSDEWAGEQYPLVWIEPAGDAAGPVLPPGLRRLPDPGRAVLSPALHALARREPAIAARFPGHGVLEPQGTRSRSERLAYVRPAANRTIAGHPAAARVRAFGPGGGPALVTTAGAAVERAALVSGAVAFLMLPAALLALAGVATASDTRERRFAILRALGAPRSTITRLSVLETASLAVLGVVPACLLWLVVAGRLTVVPGTGHDVYPGDLALPVPAAFAVGTAVACLCATSAAVLTRAAAPSRSPRPLDAPQRARAWRAVPLGLSLGATAGGASLGGRTGGLVMLVSLLGALAGLPLAAPTLLPALGRLLTRGHSVAALLAGRRLEWDPRRIGRPFGLFGVIVLLAIFGGCYTALLAAGESSIQSGGAITLRWSDPHAGDLPALARALRPARVIPVPRRQGVVVVTGAEPLEALEQRTRTAAQRTVTAWTVVSPLASRQRPSPLDPWLRTGLAVGLLVLGLASVLLVVDAVLRSRRSNAPLVAIGMSSRRRRHLEAMLFALPFSAVAGLSVAVGLTVTALFVSVSDVRAPAAWLGVVLASTFAAGLAGTLVVARHDEVGRTRPSPRSSTSS